MSVLSPSKEKRSIWPETQQPDEFGKKEVSLYGEPREDAGDLQYVAPSAGEHLNILSIFYLFSCHILRDMCIGNGTLSNKKSAFYLNSAIEW